MVRRGNEEWRLVLSKVDPVLVGTPRKMSQLTSPYSGVGEAARGSRALSALVEGSG